MFWPCETRTSTCRNFATISSGVYRFFGIAVLLHVKRHSSGRTTSKGEDQSEVQHEQVARAVLDRAPLIVTMAGLYRRKGIGDLIAAFGQIANEFPKASLLVLGWGPDQGSFERQKNSVNGGERIHLQGFVAKPRSILRQATVFVLASHTESFPLSLAEAR